MNLVTVLGCGKGAVRALTLIAPWNGMHAW